jgi:hypothetical protein
MKNATDVYTSPAPANLIPHIAPKTYLPGASHLSDDQLLKLCQRYGEQSRIWKQKFAGLLPEVNRRRLYEKKGFSSVFEFALKLAGMSEKQVCRILNLERNFADKPALHQMLINGDVSPNKLIKIAPIATKENQDDLAQQVKILPCRALETLARDEKNIEGQFRRHENDAGGLVGGNSAGQSRVYPNGQSDEQAGFEHQNGLNEHSEFEYQNGLNKPENSPENAHVSLPLQSGAQYVNSDIELVAALKKEVKEKLVELKRKGIDINVLIMEMIGQRASRIEEEKQKIAGKVSPMLANNAPVRANSTSTRYIPVSVKRVLRLEHGQKCSIPNCNKEAGQIHHSQRYALNSVHDPRYLAPLCEEHHKIAHAADAAWNKKRTGWTQGGG